MSADELTEAARLERRRLTQRIIGLSIAQLDAAPTGETRRQLIQDAVSHLADIGAAMEGRARREVPPAGDRALADQLGVMVDDVLVADAPAGEQSRRQAKSEAHGVLVRLRRSL